MGTGSEGNLIGTIKTKRHLPEILSTGNFPQNRRVRLEFHIETEVLDQPAYWIIFTWISSTVNPRYDVDVVFVAIRVFSINVRLEHYKTA